MRTNLLLAILFFAFLLIIPVMASADQPPEMIAEKMAVKFTRGLANAVTGVVELPKQTVLTGREMGGVGYVIGPLKGIGMMVYRTVFGAIEMITFPVPQPGYYDPMIDPPYVWEGWEPKRDGSSPVIHETDTPPPLQGNH